MHSAVPSCHSSSSTVRAEEPRLPLFVRTKRALWALPFRSAALR
ncbi:hypothetical protein BURMUCGD2M_4435 [Burkholderia multivorans CGD2M]|uniref:Uncharacterized protein n=1 Tax=Burkholderia multivorans CGD2 TaxID=513052 RepID=B9BH11_9BURK|nr:hypothetical protein BURMUCGD2_4447 [Burkholderia multivorans CGD2]EEE14993.1 hypothetical protein BURMUCGD2M_4435 [Burkholderia multivorans CGD2M]